MNRQIRTAVFILLAGIAAEVSTPAWAQRATSLAQAKTLYVENFRGTADAPALREKLVNRIEKEHRFRIVNARDAADAILEGTGQIWMRGYVSTNARTPANNRTPVYAGYLSLEVTGAAGQPLWSWLATPGKLQWKSIVDDLADRAANRLIDAAREYNATATTGPSAGKLVQTELTGGGATFPAPLYRKWFEDFEELHAGVKIHYSLLGSKAGVEKLVDGSLDFAGSDVAPEIADTAAAGKMKRVASVMGAVVAIYNLPGEVRDLHFTPQALADIYLGKVKMWNDPEIRRSNPGLNFPDAAIAVVHRSEGSGTTWVWSSYLSKVSPEWSTAVGHGLELKWPVGTGAEGNDGVADMVSKTPNSIGYVEMAYAIQRQLSFAGVRNRAGQYIHADLDTLAEAARSVGADTQVPADISDAPGKNAYPIAAFTWLVIPAEANDPARKAALAELLRWVLTSGQKECSALGYEPLPREIAERQLRDLGNQ